MRKFTVCLLMVLTALLSVKAFAADQITEVNVVPDPKLVHRSLSQITVQFMEARYGIADKVDVSGITLSRKGSTEMLYALPNPRIDYAKLILEFGYKGDTEAATVTTEGIYTLHIPEGAVTTFDTGTPCGNIDIEFTVGADATHEMSNYILTPAAGTVEEITTVEIAFPDSKGLDWFHKDLFGKGEFSTITLTQKNNPSVKYTAIKKKFDNNYTVTLAFTAEGSSEEAQITEPGTYVLDIPAGMFMKDFSTVQNDAITAEYIIEGDAMAPEFAGMVSSPADGEKVGGIGQIRLTFPNMPDGLDYPVNDISRATITTPDGEKFYGFSAQVASAEGGTYNQLRFSFAPEGAYTVTDAKEFTAAGQYDINIPAGILKTYGKDVVNSEINLSVTVDPMLNFTYNMSPESGIFHQEFCDVVFTCGRSLKSLFLNPDCTHPATISLGDTSYDFTAVSTDETTVTLSLPSDAVPATGTWTIKVPAEFFGGINQEGITIYNPTEITGQFIIKEAERFDFTINPADDSTIEFFKNITLEFSGNNLKTVNVNPEAGQPKITGSKGNNYDLTGRISGKFVIFTVAAGTDLDNDTYSLAIPAGYVTTVDRDNLTAMVGEVTSTFTIAKKPVEDYTDGIMFLNEGWFGHDTGSLNFLSNAGEWTYDVFLRNNPDHRLGITSQYGQCFGDNIYVVSKQSEGEEATDGGVFTIMDARTMQFRAQINQLPDPQSQPRAFCAWDEHKGYLSTKLRIYTVDLDNMEVLSVVPGTDIYTSFDSNGEMLRYGNYIFAIRQSSGVDAINPENDDVIKIPAELAEAFAVTPDGSLYVATRNESNEFIKISPTDLSIVEIYDIPENQAKIANIWTTWRKAPLATDITTNTVYYVTEKATNASYNGANTVARYDFDSKEFTEAFITLPGVADGEAADWVLYGEGISVDPATGYILLTAVEAGYGAHYSKNRVFVADPATGEILKDRSYTLEDGYWFPAMALYPDFEAPVINTEGINLSAQPESFTLDVASMTTLAVGNKHLVNYTVTSSNDDICSVTPVSEAPGKFEISVKSPDANYTLELTADYQGKIATTTLSTLSSVGNIGLSDNATPSDVYNLQGICIMRNATTDDIDNLPAGIYIVNGRKYRVK